MRSKDGGCDLSGEGIEEYLWIKIFFDCRRVLLNIPMVILLA